MILFDSMLNRAAPLLDRFQRRLLLLGAVGCVMLMLLGAQLFRLAFFEHAAHAKETARYLTTRRLLPASRGTIFDRRGEVLASDRASWNVLVDYDAITGRWAANRARAQALQEIGKAAWATLSPQRRTLEVLQRLDAWENTLETQVFGLIAQAGGFDRSELERRFDEIVARAERQALTRREALRDAALRRYGADARIEGIEQEIVAAQREAHVLLTDVSDEVAFAFQRISDAYPKTVTVQAASERIRAWEHVAFDLPRRDFVSPVRSNKPVKVELHGVLDHLLGSTRTQVYPEDLARRRLFAEGSSDIIDLGGYRADRDIVGSSGIERRAEDHLRGLRGVVERDLEHSVENRFAPVPGQDLTLSIDIRLQARVQALFSEESGLAEIQQWQRGWDPEGSPRAGPLPVGWKLNGAFVVLDIASGEVLAAGSTPTLSEGRAMDAVQRTVEQPQIFRAFEGVYPPGSILKPLVFVAAAAEGVVQQGETIECKGHFFPDAVDSVRCWIYRPTEGRSTVHGPLAASEALARSCNIFFYTLADRLGTERLVRWLGAFGLGRALDADCAVERVQADGKTTWSGTAAASMPDAAQIADWKLKRDRTSPVLLGIGQGALSWTPLQAANAFATLARGGVFIPPTVIRRTEIPRGAVLGLPAWAVEDALAGLRQSVSASHGTGHHVTLENGVKEPLFDIDALTIWGKTGTATASLLALDNDADGETDARVRTDHAWFVGLVAPKGEAPQYAVAVLLEHGGSGGKVAGPVAAQVFRALAAEGYLGSEAARAHAAEQRK